MVIHPSLFTSLPIDPGGFITPIVSNFQRILGLRDSHGAKSISLNFGQQAIDHLIDRFSEKMIFSRQAVSFDSRRGLCWSSWANQLMEGLIAQIDQPEPLVRLAQVTQNIVPKQPKPNIHFRNAVLEWHGQNHAKTN